MDECRPMRARELRLVLALYRDDDAPVRFTAFTTPGDDLSFDRTTVGAIRRQIESFDPDEGCCVGPGFVVMGFQCYPALTLSLGRTSGSQLVN